MTYEILEERKNTIFNKYSEKEKECITFIANLSGKKRHEIATLFFLETPDGIFWPPMYYQSFDHCEMHKLKCKGMNIDWYMVLNNTLYGEDTALYIEFKKDYKNFDDFEDGKEAKLLERLVNKSRAQDIAVFATHTVSCEKGVKLSDLTIKKIFWRKTGTEEKGSWYDVPEGINGFDFALSLYTKEKFDWVNKQVEKDKQGEQND